MKKIFIISLILLMSAVFVVVQSSYSQETKRTIDLPEIKTELKQAEGADIVQRYCNICHSLDYITMQPTPSRAQWEGIVNKMIKTFGAPIPASDAGKIVNYLAANYGSGK